MSTITNAQVAFIKSLVAEREIDSATEAALATARAATMAGTFPKDAATILITTLKALPVKGARTVTVPEVGAYRLSDGRIIRIQNNQYGTRRYGKIYDEQSGRWEYVKGLTRLVAGLEPLTLEQAQEFGVRTGQCAICARTLTQAESVARGIGPVCAGKF